MKFTNLKISRECIFPIENIAHVRSRKTFYQISVNFRNPRFRSVSNPRKPVFGFRTSPTTTRHLSPIRIQTWMRNFSAPQQRYTLHYEVQRL